MHPFILEVGDGSLRGTGEIDLAVGSRLLATIYRLADSSPVDCLVVDLSQVTFIDSSGLNALLRAHRRLEQQGAALVLVDVSPVGQSVMDLGGLTELFGIGASAPPNENGNLTTRQATKALAESTSPGGSASLLLG